MQEKQLEKNDRVAVNSNQEITTNIISSNVFNANKVIHRLSHYLPSQTPLKDFIHHNSLHAFQDLKFYDAIFKASKIFGYQVTLQLADFRKLFAINRISEAILNQVILQQKGNDLLEAWKYKLLQKEYNETNQARIGSLRSSWRTHYHLDLDTLVQPLLFRVINSYLDQGIAVEKFPTTGNGFLDSIRVLELNSYSSFFKTKRAQNLLQNKLLTITDLLKIVVGNEAYFEQYLYDQQFSHRGWSGMVATIENNEKLLLDPRKISLSDVIFFELLLEIDNLDYHFGKNWLPLSTKLTTQPVDLFADVPDTELNEVLKLWQDAFEWSYYDEVLSGIASVTTSETALPSDKSFQAIFCIDERECSIRRHLENAAPFCETFGSPGFFGVEFFFQPQNGKFYDKLCPAPVTPKYLIKEFDAKAERKHELLYHDKSVSNLSGVIYALALGYFAGVKMLQNIFRPKMSPAISNAFLHMDADSQLTIENKNLADTENGLQIGFTTEEMAVRVEGLLRGIGLTNNFAQLIYVVAHGSSSANNPHHGAHDCGACSGRPGSVNARVFSFMANHPKVRLLLNERGISIPDTTQFVGALHDTAADQIGYYDTNVLSAENAVFHKNNAISFENALDLNSKERSRRFAAINTKSNLQTVRKAIKDRSVSLFEPRPELGHGTNSLCIVGRRNLTKNLFLDRRAFLNSYNYNTDPEGKLLTGIMKPLGPVCGGINLEYYFSRVDNHKLGAGTKLPHNVMGLIGVANSCDGDLRPGLPLQMIEVHDPIRLLIIVEHFPDVILKTIQSVPEMYEWFINEWVHLVSLHPETNQFYYFSQGAFVPYHPLPRKIAAIANMLPFFETAKEMETNYIVDATQENLPVYTLN